MAELRIVEAPESPWDAEPGEMWPCQREKHIEPGRAPCWVVRLPGVAFCWHTNERASDEPHALWDVSGEPPLITVAPSINVGPEIWHGHIQEGVLSPDA